MKLKPIYFLLEYLCIWAWPTRALYTCTLVARVSLVLDTLTWYQSFRFFSLPPYNRRRPHPSPPVVVASPWPAAHRPLPSPQPPATLSLPFPFLSPIGRHSPRPRRPSSPWQTRCQALPRLRRPSPPWPACRRDSPPLWSSIPLRLEHHRASLPLRRTSPLRLACRRASPPLR
jgi:hypothetical protein